MFRLRRVPPTWFGDCLGMEEEEEEVEGGHVGVRWLVGVVDVVWVYIGVCCAGVGEWVVGVREGSGGRTMFLGAPVVGHFSIVFGWGLGS